MKKLIVFAALIVFPSLAFAYPPSLIGGKRMQGGTAHNVSVGWPSITYEWWNAGSPDWALGAELVYGDWSGEYSDVEFGLGFNVPLRWQVHESGRVAVGFKFQPGMLIAAGEGPGDPFVFGMRGEVGVPLTIGVHNIVNIITGVSVPFSLFIVEGADNPGVVIPILPRIGVEVLPEGKISIWMLAEFGPTIGIYSGDADVDLGVRAMVGATFW